MKDSEQLGTAEACEKYIDGLRRMRRVIISDPSSTHQQERLQAALNSLQLCARIVARGVAQEISEDHTSQSIQELTLRFRGQQHLEAVEPIARVSYAQCSSHLATLSEQYRSGGNQAAANVLLDRIFGGLTQPHNFHALTRYLNQEQRIAVAPLATDAFLLALIGEFRNRFDQCHPLPIGIAATDPYPGDEYGFEGGSHCLLPEVGHHNCVIMTDLVHDGVTRRECMRIIMQKYSDANVV